MKKIIAIFALLLAFGAANAQSTVILDTIQLSKHIVYTWNGKASIDQNQIVMNVTKLVIVDNDTLIVENKVFSTQVSTPQMVTIFSGLLPAVVTDVRTKVILDAKLE